MPWADENVLRLAPWEEIDRSVPEGFPLQVTRGKVAVAMHTIADAGAGACRLGGVLVPKVGRLGDGKFGARVGVVWSVGGCDYDDEGGEVPMELKVGDVVGVRPYRGEWLEAGSEFEGRAFKRQIRVFGYKDWWYGEIPFKFEGGAVLPTYDWCVVQRPRRFTGDVLVPEASAEVDARRSRAEADAELGEAIERFLRETHTDLGKGLVRMRLGREWFERLLALCPVELRMMYAAVYDEFKAGGWSQFEAEQFAQDVVLCEVCMPMERAPAVSRPVLPFVDGVGRVTAAGPRALGLIGKRVAYSHPRTTKEYAPLVFERGEDASRVMVRAGSVTAVLE